MGAMKLHGALTLRRLGPPRARFVRTSLKTYFTSKENIICLLIKLQNRRCRGLKPEPLDELGRVVGLAGREQRVAELLDGAEGVHSEQLLSEGAYETLGAAVALWRADESRRVLGAEERQLVLERARHVSRPVVVADGKAARDALGEAVEVLAHTLAQRLQGLEAHLAHGAMPCRAA